MTAGDLVVIDGLEGVFRLERLVDDGRVRCFSYVDGRFVVVDKALVHPCPPMTRAAP
ncbi:MAG: hypothetical protein Q8O67_12195 [Deltaproteobacteria bacterium]|nr:hypothetical protein [Deltaproteobacteria bacterium]